MNRIDRRRFIELIAGSTLGIAPGAFLIAGAIGAETDVDVDNVIHAPSDSNQWPQWRSQLDAWRKKVRRELNYDDTFYNRKEFEWATGNFACCFGMMCDLTFYDPQGGSYLVESLLDDAQREFGGFDSIVLWHAYPRLGFDQRNQFDFYRDMPGGLQGLRDLSRQFHERGVKVFVDYNPWDTGTRREGRSDLDLLIEMVQAIEADGIFLDTMNQSAETFRSRLDAARRGAVLESELALPLSGIRDHHMSWAQWFKDSSAPGVLRNKWFERRHMQHQICRWNDDHTAELHTAWMNGSGMMVWENVFGSLKLWSPRDRSLLRAMLPIQRRYQKLFSGESWVPLVRVSPSDVFASLWSGESLRLWTLVNRAEEPRVARLGCPAGEDDNQQYFDLVTGTEIKAELSDDGLQLTVPLSPRGIGSVIAGDERALGRDFSTFLAGQRRLDTRAETDPQPSELRPTLKPVAPARKYLKSEMPANMVAIDIDRHFTLQSTIISRECGFYVPPFGYDAVGKHKQRVEQKRDVQLSPYAIDLTPVTNAQFNEFLRSSEYRPKHPENFLKHWLNGKPPTGLEDHPVVYVDMDDARCYARWAGKQLPTEEQWQYAAAGPESRNYPWGGSMKPDCCNAGSAGGTTAVKAFPEGRSHCGCYDMCGNTWEWTESERSDGRTRFCILKGGSWYRADGSLWYSDGGPQPNHHAAKFLMMWSGLDRCSSIGFRCVVELKEK